MPADIQVDPTRVLPIITKYRIWMKPSLNTGRTAKAPAHGEKGHLIACSPTRVTSPSITKVEPCEHGFTRVMTNQTAHSKGSRNQGFRGELNEREALTPLILPTTAEEWPTTLISNPRE